MTLPMLLLATFCSSPASNAEMLRLLKCTSHTLPWSLQSFIEKTDLEGLEQARQEDREGMLQFNKTMMDVSSHLLMPVSS